MKPNEPPAYILLPTGKQELLVTPAGYHGPQPSVYATAWERYQALTENHGVWWNAEFKAEYHKAYDLLASLLGSSEHQEALRQEAAQRDAIRQEAAEREAARKDAAQREAIRQAESGWQN